MSKLVKDMSPDELASHRAKERKRRLAWLAIPENLEKDREQRRQRWHRMTPEQRAEYNRQRRESRSDVQRLKDRLYKREYKARKQREAEAAQYESEKAAFFAKLERGEEV